jgi:hypothetical protein
MWLCLCVARLNLTKGAGRGCKPVVGFLTVVRGQNLKPDCSARQRKVPPAYRYRRPSGGRVRTSQVHPSRRREPCTSGDNNSNQFTDELRLHREIRRVTRAFLAEIRIYAQEPAVHTRTRCGFRARAGRDGEAADQSSRPRIRSLAPSYRGAHEADLCDER